MISPREKIIEFVEQGAIPREKIYDALSAGKVTPDGTAWRSFIDRLLIWLGGSALALSGMFFVAYNWDDIGRFAKFGMVEVSIVLAIAAYWKLGENKVSGKVSLLMATIFLGVLLALYGQTYQTGADTWQLFFNWALLMLPWALIGCFPAIWIVWVGLINLSIVLYFQTLGDLIWHGLGSDSGMLWLLFIFNTLALIAWEFLAETWHWLSQRWAIRLLGVGSGASITWLVIHAVFASEVAKILPGLVWLAWLAALYFVYRRKRPDLFMLAGGCLSGLVGLVTFLSHQMFFLIGWSVGAFLFLGLVVIGLGSGSALWLKTIHKEWQS